MSVSPYSLWYKVLLFEASVIHAARSQDTLYVHQVLDAAAEGRGRTKAYLSLHSWPYLLPRTNSCMPAGAPCFVACSCLVVRGTIQSSGV